MAGDTSQHGIGVEQTGNAHDDVGAFALIADGVFAGCALIRARFEHGGGGLGVGAQRDQGLRRHFPLQGCDEVFAYAAALTVDDQYLHASPSQGILLSRILARLCISYA